MKPKSLVAFFLACSAIVFACVLYRIAQLLPVMFELCYRIKADDLQYFTPFPTRFAAKNAWVFSLALILIWIATLAILRRASESILGILIVGFCLQCAVLWTAMFCFFYDAFLGTMSLHHLPRFEFGEFVGFEGGNISNRASRYNGSSNSFTIFSHEIKKWQKRLGRVFTDIVARGGFCGGAGVSFLKQAQKKAKKSCAFCNLRWVSRRKGLSVRFLS